MIFSFKNSISKHLLTPLAISGAILSGYYFVQFNLKKTFVFTIYAYVALGIYYIAVNCFFQPYFDEDYFSYQLIQTAGQQYLKPGMTIITSDWETASKLSFWLPGQPAINTLACGRENQYQYWQHDVRQQKEVIYFDFIDRSACIKQYFTDCQKLNTLVHQGSSLGVIKMPTIHLFTYYCR